MEFFIQAEKFLLPAQVKIDALDRIVAIRRRFGVNTAPVRLEMLDRVLKAVPWDSPLKTLLLDFACKDFDSNDECMEYIADEFAIRIPSLTS